MKNIVYIFLISMLPIIELRGAIPIAAMLEVEYYYAFAVSVIGNLLPVPFILLFIPKILEFLGKFKPLEPVVGWVLKKADKHSKKVLSGAFIGLLSFVMLPIPGTGAWTGALIAALFKLPFWRSMLAIALGVIGCGIIMSLATYGAVGFLSFLL